MKYKCEFNKTELKYNNLKSTELFRWSENGTVPFFKCNGGWVNLDAGNSGADFDCGNKGVVRIRIDRVDSDGVPVFVDA